MDDRNRKRYDLGGWRGLWRALTRPEEDTHPDRVLLADAANVLQVGEFQLLQLAGRDWLGRDLTRSEIDHWFRRLMYHDHAPAWARSYAREVLTMHAEGLLDPNRPEYHIYDSDPPAGIAASLKNFVLISAAIVAAFLVLLWVANHMVTQTSQRLPPFMDDDTGRLAPAEERPPRQR